MDDKNRTCSTPFDIPDEARPLLCRAADVGLERACDFGDWDDGIRAGVLTAARTVDIFYIGMPSAFQVAELADSALAWHEPPGSRPRTLDALAEHFASLGEARELIELRDRALRQAGLPLEAGGER